MEQALRKTAIERYLKGELPKSIYTDLRRNSSINRGELNLW